MESTRYQLIKIAMSTVVAASMVGVAIAAVDQYSPEVRGSQIKVMVNTWRNASGHLNIKTDLMFPEVLKSSGQSFELTQFTAVVNGVNQIHLASHLIVPEVRRGPTGYELAQGLGWYRLHLDPRTWEEARTACEDEGAHLAVINSQKEADVLKTLFQRAPDAIPNVSYNHLAHIGYTDIVEGQYLTIFGETLEKSGYAVWSSGQPNNGRGDKGDVESDCGGVERNGKLNDTPCKSLCAFFCEYPL